MTLSIFKCQSQSRFRFKESFSCLGKREREREREKERKKERKKFMFIISAYSEQYSVIAMFKLPLIVDDEYVVSKYT